MRAILYCRTETITRGQAPAAHPAILEQLQRCRQYAARAGHDVRVEILDVCSGRGLAHPRLETWVHGHPHKAAVVIVASWDRLGRTPEAQEASLAWLRDHGLSVEAADDAESPT